MSLMRLLLVVIIFFSLASYPSAFIGEKPPVSISIEEVLSIGSLDDNALFQWVGVDVDEDGFIFLTDGMDYSVKKFTPLGNLIRKAGQRGQGPGEFLAPRLLGCSDERIYVTDQNILGLQVFDRNLKYISRIPFKTPAGDLKVFPDGRFAMADVSISQPGKVVLFNKAGQILMEYRYSEKRGPVMMDWVSFEMDASANLYLAYSFQDKIEKFDGKGRRLWSKSLIGVKSVKRQKVGPWKVPQSLVFKDIELDTHGRLYILGGGYSEKPSRTVYVLNHNGERLTSLVLPDSSHCIHIDRWNCLYSRANEGITLKKYRIVNSAGIEH
ncbi:hypothetical protein ACFLT2_13780 [Acidobacteriota bacterium]